MDGEPYLGISHCVILEKMVYLFASVFLAVKWELNMYKNLSFGGRINAITCGGMVPSTEL